MLSKPWMETELAKDPSLDDESLFNRWVESKLTKMKRTLLVTTCCVCGYMMTLGHLRREVNTFRIS